MKKSFTNHLIIACEEGPSVFANFLTLGSLLLVIASLPLSLFFVVKVVQVKHLFRIKISYKETFHRSMRGQLYSDLDGFCPEVLEVLECSSSSLVLILMKKLI